MVKGISRQVIVVQAPEPKLFEQAIFILKDNMGEGITDEALLKEAQQVIGLPDKASRKRRIWLYGMFWAAAGAMATGAAWIVTLLIF
ncbi:MAG: translation initiation factor 2 [Faecousia sp.]